jgi:hypothetical protein
MALRVLQYTKVIPAGTPKSAPIVLPMSLDNWAIEQIDLEVDVGPSGLMGFYISNNGVPWIPNSIGEYLIWNGQSQSWPFTDQPTGSGWAVVGYNIGNYDHSVAVRFHVNPIVVPEAVTAPAVVTFVTSDVSTSDAVTLD